MSTGPLFKGFVIAAGLSISLTTVEAAEHSSKPGHHSSENGSAYSAVFPPQAAPGCLANSSEATADSLHNPFASFAGSGAYSSIFFGGSGGSVGTTSESEHHGNAMGGGSGQAPSFAGTPSTGAPSNTTVTNPGRGNQPLIVATTAALRARAFAAGSPSATPEPTTFLLLALGGAGLFVSRRNRARRP